MIRIYDSKENNFNHNGLGLLKDTLICEVYEELNSLYEMYLEYPIYGMKASLIKEENIIKASTPQGNQLFRIYKVVKDLNVLKAYARHIFYDLADNFIEDTFIQGQNGAGALDQILSKTQYLHSFRGMSSISKINNSYFERKNIVEALLDIGEENCYLNKWGGEVVRDNFDIKFYTQRGDDRGVTIGYGKNLLGIEEELDISTVATRIIPQGAEGLLLPEKYVDSPYINNYIHPKIRKVEFNNIKAQKEGKEQQDKEALPLEEAYNALRRGTKLLYDLDKIDIPKVNYKIDFLELSKTEEYKDYKILERVLLGDTVTIKHSKMDIDIKAKVIKYKWNSILNKYEELELGNFKNSFVDVVSKIESKIKSELEALETSVLDKAKDKATELINSGLGGYVLKNRDEILIMDTDNINTATKVWRWNKNGLGYSSTGYNGKFGLAMTSDGSIVADFITVGVLNGLLLKAGSVKSNAISQDYTKTIEDKITGIKDTLTQEFKVSNGELLSSINSNKKDIEGKVSSLNSQVQQTASGILSVVQYNKEDSDGKISTLSTQIKQTQNSISSKVDEGKLGSLIEQKSNNVRIAFNNISQSISMEPEGIVVSHSGTGNYTKLNSEGVIRYTNYNKATYHYLSWQSEGMTGGKFPDVYFTLPDEFKGKDFKVSVMPKATGGGLWEESMARINLDYSRDIDNGKVRVTGNWVSYVRTDKAYLTDKELKFNIIVIA
ncbi:phage tail spike protein [Clostridium hydrogeniformans]|uniref:phage tail spike protein n=1 Tax=Clostridium hydrogeniformans TaxID=349933 RepID=UPI0006925FC0|nr:phage tail spike protein [Clostridium hydrogeniformans]